MPVTPPPVSVGWVFFSKIMSKKKKKDQDLKTAYRIEPVAWWNDVTIYTVVMRYDTIQSKLHQRTN